MLLFQSNVLRETTLRGARPFWAEGPLRRSGCLNMFDLKRVTLHDVGRLLPAPQCFQAPSSSPQLGLFAGRVGFWPLRQLHFWARTEKPAVTSC